MARRSSRRGAKIQPAPKTLTFLLPDGAETAFAYVDLSQVCSLMNRRFYRQGLNWAVGGFTFFTQGPGEIDIYKVPDTWVASNAWHKAFATWSKLNDEALAEAESLRPKFLDFKTFMDAGHHNAGVPANLLPIDENGASPSLGEWEYSQIVIPDNTNPGFSSIHEFVFTGTNYPGAGASGLNAVSLIEGYAASRGLPDIQDPNTPDDASDMTGPSPQNWISATFNDGTSQLDSVMTDLIDENNQAPYPFENDGTNLDTMYPGGANQVSGLQLHDAILVTATTIGGKSSSGGTNFQCGLVKIRTTVPGAGNLMLIHLVPGPARGYMSQPMQDV